MNHPDIPKQNGNWSELYDKFPAEYNTKTTTERRVFKESIVKSSYSSSQKRHIKIGNWRDDDRFRDVSSGSPKVGGMLRRESFLHSSSAALGPSLPGSPGNVLEEELIVTPFAQILARLRDVRTSLETTSSRGSAPSFLHQNNKQSAMEAETGDSLASLDWCLKQLEQLQTSRSVSGMAVDKFKQMLDQEMSVLPKNIARHLTENYSASQIEHEMGEEENEEYNIGNQKRQGIFSGGQSVVSSVSQVSRDMSLITAAGKLGLSFSNNGLEIFKKKAILDKIDIDTWGLDVFSASRAIRDSRVLTATTFKIFQERGLCHTFKIDQRTLLTFLMTIEDHYLKSVPYHNHLHAADVTQSTHLLLSSAALADCFTPLEVMAAILACAVHDVDHPGVNNLYLINTRSDLALMYNDDAVLENHHLAVAFKLLQNPACDIFSSLSHKQRVSVRKMMIDMVLATDMSKHMKLLADLKTMLETKKVTGNGVLMLDDFNDRIQVLQNMVHCSDLSNPTKPLELYKEWVDRLMDEFWAQGDREKAEGLEVSAMCDRDNANVEKSQVGFISFIVQPLWETWAELVHPDINHILDILKTNKSYYEKLLE